jgi:4-amino-4-deoxy-L-arabinose transferase-like glycosyltransferase
MIQRIQSLYLLLTSLLSVLFLSGSFLTFLNNSETEITVNFRGIWQSAGEGNVTLIGHQIVLSVLIILILLISIAAIFLYRNRKFQMKLTIAIIFLAAASVAVMVFYSFSIIRKFNVDIVPGIKMFMPLIIIIFGILAYRRIEKDENLIRSYDRLR